MYNVYIVYTILPLTLILGKRCGALYQPLFGDCLVWPLTLRLSPISRQQGRKICGGRNTKKIVIQPVDLLSPLQRRGVPYCASWIITSTPSCKTIADSVNGLPKDREGRDPPLPLVPCPHAPLHHAPTPCQAPLISLGVCHCDCICLIQTGFVCLFVCLLLQFC